jgi:hypothetical protein
MRRAGKNDNSVGCRNQGRGTKSNVFLFPMGENSNRNNLGCIARSVLVSFAIVPRWFKQFAGNILVHMDHFWSIYIVVVLIRDIIFLTNGHESVCLFH